MGNANTSGLGEESTERVAVRIRSHRWPRGQDNYVFSPEFSGKALGENPRSFKPTFKCLDCKRENYDGGMCQVVKCPCGVNIRRNENNVVSYSHPNLGSFIDVFEQCNSSFYGEKAELSSLTLGVFENTIPTSMYSGISVNYNRIYGRVLKPYFTHRQRCISENDFLKIGDCSFKVLAAHPSQGFVTKNTRIHCYSEMSDSSLERVKIVPLAPHSITTDIFQDVIFPYLQEQPKHLHEEQHLNIRGLECVVARCVPSNGIFTQETLLEYVEHPADPLQRVSLIPFADSVPLEFRTMDREDLIPSVVDCFVMPYLKGWNRVLYQGKVVSIQGIDFRVDASRPGYGVVSPETRVVYDGKLLRRRRSDSIIVHNRALLSQLTQIMHTMRVISSELSQNLIQQLPCFQLEKLPSNDEQKSCLVCMNEFGIGNEVKVLPCFHLFHKECIDQWLPHSRLCPTCKNPCDSET